MARLEGAYDQVNYRLDSLDGHVNGLRQDLTALGVSLNSRLDALGNRLDSKIEPKNKAARLRGLCLYQRRDS